MDELEAIYETEDDIPSEYRALYSEKNGKFEITGINGVKTQGDVDRLQRSLHAAQADNKKLKGQIREGSGNGKWGDMDYEETMTQLDRIPELEAAAEGKLDENKIDEIVSKRLEGRINSKTAPLQRQIEQLTTENGELKEVNSLLVSAADTRSREDVLRPLLSKAKVLPEHHEDVFLWAEKHLEKGEEGFFARDGVNGVTAGATPEDWLSEMLERRPGWLPPTQGGGASQLGKGGGGLGGASNPWSHDGWDMTKQGAFFRQYGAEKAQQMAKSAGTTVGGPKPLPKK